MSFQREVMNDELTRDIIGVAIDVHKTLGSQHSEKLYQNAFAHGLEEEGFDIEQETEVPVIYRGRKLDSRFADLLVDDEVVVEVKAVRSLTDEHFTQLGTNVRLLEKTRGLLINFGATTVKVRRFANDRVATSANLCDVAER